MHVLTGSWTANLEKSRRHPNHQFRSATMHFEVDGRTVSLRFDGINASGRDEEGARTFEADGHARPDAAAPGVLATSTIGPRGLEVTATKDGAPVGRASYEVSDDGGTLTATTAAVDASGKSFEQVIVFDRL